MFIAWESFRNVCAYHIVFYKYTNMFMGNMDTRFSIESVDINFNRVCSRSDSKIRYTALLILLAQIPRFLKHLYFSLSNAIL